MPRPHLNFVWLCSVSAALVLGCAARVPLHDLPVDQQREVGEAAVVEVCGYPLDVESPITRRHRETLDLAHEYIDIVSETVSPGELSRFFTPRTLAACGPNASEWGQIRAAISVLVQRYGTEAEVLARLEQVSSWDWYCAHVVPGMEEALRPRYEAACRRLVAL